MISLDVFFFLSQRIKTQVPYVVTLHGSYAESGLSDQQLEEIVGRVSHWVYTADRNLEPFNEVVLPASRISKFANAMPIDHEPFPRTRDSMGIEHDAVVFTLVARGIRRKGWRASIMAFRKLRERKPSRQMHLLLCGEGAIVDEYARLHADDPDITFLGYQSRIHGLYRLSDCAIIPSRFAGESYPLCLIQALQVGLPVIATDVGEIRCMLGEDEQYRAGILIEPIRDTNCFIDKLSDSMEVMISEEKRRAFSANAYQQAVKFDMGRVAGRYSELYNSLLGSNLQRKGAG